MCTFTYCLVDTYQHLKTLPTSTLCQPGKLVDNLYLANLSQVPNIELPDIKHHERWLQGFKVQVNNDLVRFASVKNDSDGMYTKWYSAAHVAATSVNRAATDVLLVCHVDPTTYKDFRMFEVEAYSHRNTELKFASKLVGIQNYNAANPLREVRVVKDIVHGVLSDYQWYSVMDYATKPISLDTIWAYLFDDEDEDK